MLLTASFYALADAEVFTGEDLNEPFTVHGRLRVSIGDPGLRMWVVGSKRILGIRLEPPDGPRAPQSIIDYFHLGDTIDDITVYANFTVEPLSPDKKGHMRPVRILSAKNIVVTSKGQVIIDERGK